MRTYERQREESQSSQGDTSKLKQTLEAFWKVRLLVYLVSDIVDVQIQCFKCLLTGVIGSPWRCDR